MWCFWGKPGFEVACMHPVETDVGSLARAISIFVLAIPEERYCLEKYGDAYRAYMNKTPRWIGIPK